MSDLLRATREPRPRSVPRRRHAEACSRWIPRRLGQICPIPRSGESKGVHLIIDPPRQSVNRAARWRAAGLAPDGVASRRHPV